ADFDLDRRGFAAGALGRAVRDAEAALDVAASCQDHHAPDAALLLKLRGTVGHVLVPDGHDLIGLFLALRGHFLGAVHLGEQEKSYEVMTVWDEYMADSAAKFQKE